MERSGAPVPYRYSPRADALNRLTDTPHETEPNWRYRCCQTIHGYNHDLRRKTRQQQDETALALKVSSGEWVQKPGSGDTGGYRVDLNQPQYRYYRSLASFPQSDRLGGGVSWLPLLLELQLPSSRNKCPNQSETRWRLLPSQWDWNECSTLGHSTVDRLV
jgi:hypothetical protein